MISDPKSLLQGYVEISSLPTTFYRIHQAIDDPHVSVTELGNIISEDAGLTVRLLRLVNSSFYSFPRKIDTVSRAIAIVGMQQLHDLVLATSIMSMFKGISPDLVSMDSFWRHSISTGVAARLLAKQRRESNVERFFISGMLHDIGRLIMYIRRPDPVRAMLQRCKSSHELLVNVEREVFGFDHTDVGYELVHRWSLPRNLQEVVLHHHRPSGAREFPIEPAIIHVADLVSHALGAGTSGECLVPPLDEGAWEVIGLPVDILEGMGDQIDSQIHAALDAILG
jgi:putative nucleotidyltransferase with HDIG domain